MHKKNLKLFVFLVSLLLFTSKEQKNQFLIAVCSFFYSYLHIYKETIVSPESLCNKKKSEYFGGQEL